LLLILDPTLSGKTNFQEILEETRKEVRFIENELFLELVKLVNGESNYLDNANNYSSRYLKRFELSQSSKDWVLDAFLDKCYEANCKIVQMIKQQLGFIVECPIEVIKENTEKFVFSTYNHPYDVNSAINRVKWAIESYSQHIESTMSSLRMKLYETNWSKVKRLNTADYVLPTERARYITSRQELEKAKQAVKDKQWDEVLNHLRPSVDLAIKEKFGFIKIQPMKSFLIDAEDFGFPLPSYTMLYDIFDEGTKRIHEGKLNTPYECERALEFVAGFIDRLDLIDVSQEKINEFKQKCKYVD
jgi:hypothetical protein